MPGITRQRRRHLREGAKPVCLTRDIGLPAFLFAPPTTLALPDFGDEVPVDSKQTRKGVEVYLQAMAEMDILQPKHWNRGNSTAIMKASLTELFDGMDLNMDMHICDNVERSNKNSHGFDSGMDASDVRQRKKWEAGQVVGGLWIEAGLPPKWFSVGGTLTKLESQCPRFAQTIIDVIARSSWALLGSITPPTVGYLASHAYWMGEDDETQIIEEELQEMRYQYEHSDDPAMVAWAKTCTKDDVECFRKKDLLKGGVPEWAFKPHSIARTTLAAMKKVKLKNASTAETERAQRILALLKQLITYDREALNEHGFVESPSEFAAAYVLRWNRSDAWTRVLDDNYEMECNAGENHAMAWASFFKEGDIRTIKESLSKLVKVSEGTKVLDRLLHMIGRDLKY